MNKLRDKTFSRDDMAEYLKDTVPYPAIEQAVILNVKIVTKQTEVVISAHSTFTYHREGASYQIDIHNAGQDVTYVLTYDDLDRSEADLSIFRYIRDSLQYLSEVSAPIEKFLDSISGEYR